MIVKKEIHTGATTSIFTRKLFSRVPQSEEYEETTLREHTLTGGGGTEGLESWAAGKK